MPIPTLPHLSPHARGVAYHEMRSDGGLRPDCKPLDAWLRATSAEALERKRIEAQRLFTRRGITFAVYGDESEGERLIPFDVIPRIISSADWKLVQRGCVQRVRALNAFLNDIYHDQEILRAGVIPAEEVLGNKLYCAAMHGVEVSGQVHAHIAGIDVICVAPSQWYVLEDNLRTPSGVSYMLENRAAMRRLFPELFMQQRIAAIDHYPDLLLRNLIHCRPAGTETPTVVVLSPGSANSAYFEHAYLAERMGVMLVEGQDLFVDRDHVYAHTIDGPCRVDVIYRRLDDDFLDPLAFRSDSLLGVPGLFAAYRAGHVTLANAVGNGVADDKATYIHVPAMIRFYLGEEPVLSNVPTYKLKDPGDRAYVLEHLEDLVVKEVHGCGGYGMLIGPTASQAEREAYRARILADPSDFIAQPTLALSTCPTFVAQGIAPRHVDLRPYVLSGAQVEVVPGALTRVALKEGSLVVNSSQGGGTKDTWVVADAS
jgi:uncharacterized circularly permuted ATP-grasp superfamily protein